jgi:hypothetical protein
LPKTCEAPPAPAYHRGVRLRGKKGREFQIHPERALWTDPTDRVVGVHRHVRVTVVGREVGAYNGFTEQVTAGQLLRVADWLEAAATGATSTVEIGTADEGVRLEHRGEGSLMAELRGELRPWYLAEPAEVVQFKLQVEPQELRRGARELRAELEAWQAVLD